MVGSMNFQRSLTPGRESGCRLGGELQAGVDEARSPAARRCTIALSVKPST